MKRQMVVFREKLSLFATEHKREINENPVFRRQFHAMCQSIGVDPLSSAKGFWADLLGIGDFYFELGVQIIEQCMITRKRNGGLLRVDELLARLNAHRRHHARAQQPISEDDLNVSIGKLACLGHGYRFHTIGAGGAAQKMLVSVPLDLSTDHARVLEAAKTAAARVSKPQLCASLQWTPERADSAISFLMQQGLVWIDNQTAPPGNGGADAADSADYWFPSLFVFGDELAALDRELGSLALVESRDDEKQ
jgi:ESCRT-II complex subunit VPS22